MKLEDTPVFTEQGAWGKTGADSQECPPKSKANSRGLWGHLP